MQTTTLRTTCGITMQGELVNYAYGILSIRVYEPSEELLTQLIKANYSVTMIEHWQTRKEYAFICIPMQKVESFCIIEEKYINIP